MGVWKGGTGGGALQGRSTWTQGPPRTAVSTAEYKLGHVHVSIAVGRAIGGDSGQAAGGLDQSLGGPVWRHPLRSLQHGRDLALGDPTGREYSQKVRHTKAGALRHSHSPGASCRRTSQPSSSGKWFEIDEPHAALGLTPWNSQRGNLWSLPPAPSVQRAGWTSGFQKEREGAAEGTVCGQPFRRNLLWLEGERCWLEDCAE